MLEVIMYISYGVLFGVAALMVRQLYYALKHFTPPVTVSKLGEEVDMPSVSICIPARNEKHALNECLEKVLASDYERLEIIVLDDVSGDDTSALIKSYAHEGVRFVKGEALPAGWLGKNHALQGLLKQASGSYIMFIDVDTRISPEAVTNVMRYMLSKRAAMVSVMPRREDGWRMSVLFSSLRYFWEIMFHRKLQPAAASSLWVVKRPVLEKTFSGFTDLKHVVQAESKIAATLAQTNDYRFLMSTEAFGVGYEKKWRSQLITSTRLLFPFLEYQVSMAIIAVLDLLILFIPISLTIVGFIIQDFTVVLLSILMVTLYAVIYGVYVHRVWKRGAVVGAILWPLLLLQEIALTVASVYQYKRRTVKWKGRKIL